MTSTYVEVETLLYIKGEHSKRQTDIGESRVAKTLIHMRRGKRDRERRW